MSRKRQRRREGRERDRGGKVGREVERERWHISRFYFKVVQVSRYSNLNETVPTFMAPQKQGTLYA